MDKKKMVTSFHTNLDRELVELIVPRKKNTPVVKHTTIVTRNLSYKCYVHFHPYSKQLMRRLVQKSISGLQAMDTEYRRLPDNSIEELSNGKFKPVLYADLFSATVYAPSALVRPDHPVKDLDFTASGSYSCYNWELFFHVPLSIAMQLSKNQRFADAQRWFHYIFDPTDDSDGPTPERYWRVRPFQYTDVKKIEEILVNLATDSDPELRQDTLRSIEAWKDAPFRPHVVARYRQEAYMYKTLMAYLDNQIAWGDSLFREDTGEAIDEALMHYALAREILGPRPQPVPNKGTIRPQTYANLRKDLDRFGNAMRDMEADLPFDLMPPPVEGKEQPASTVLLRGMGKSLYFRVPRNEKLLSYWDTVDDRLFKIHNSLNIQGVFRQLALFEPPIDPAMLARATAAGLDIGAVISGLNQPLPLVRFQLLVQKATEICQEVKSLGNALLSAMEKEDGEAMQILRARHESSMLKLAEQVRYAQWQESTKAKEGLMQSLALAMQRYTYYERQLGKDAKDIIASIPAFEELKVDGLMNFDFQSIEGEVAPREIAVDIANDLDGAGGRIVSSHEEEELSLQSASRTLTDTVEGFILTGKALKMIPDFGVHAHFWGIGPRVDLIGGTKLADVMWFAADVARFAADRLNFNAGRAAKIGSYARREQDWAYQSNLAAGEIGQMMKQLRGAQIREAIAEKELENHRQQMKNAEEVDFFLNEEGANKKGKATNKALYTWMKREVKGLYGQFFQFAFDVARKAERALQHELGNTELTYLKYGYLAGKEGLLAGEKMHLDIKRMEMAYHELNQREYELTKHISLLQLAPAQLLALRMNGSCTVTLPETLFDLDGPGHYFRRIRTVSVSIPCVTGPYASVNCTLTLTKSSIRRSPVLTDGAYARDGAEDARFSDHFGSLQSIVTSSAQNDSGMFETNLRDERYLPFEYSGAVSEWRLELPAPGQDDPRQFDYTTISDVIIHMRYTARQAGQPMKTAALTNITEQMAMAGAMGTAQLFSIRHEFPSEWAKLKTIPGGGAGTLTLSLADVRYPFWTKKTLDAGLRSKVRVWQRKADNSIEDLPVVTTPEQKPIEPLVIDLTTTAMTDLWVVVEWGTGG